MLRDEQKLRLDDPVEEWLPSLRGLPLATVDSPLPTIRHLLSMSAGLPEDDAWADRLESISEEEFDALLASPKVYARAPGTAYEYSNLSYAMLGRIISEASGMNYRDFITQRLLIPLGMQQTTWSSLGIDPTQVALGYHLADGVWIEQPVQEPGAFSAIGGLWSSIADLSIWVAGFIDAFPPRGEPDSHPLSRASRREMQQVHTLLPLTVLVIVFCSITMLAFDSIC